MPQEQLNQIRELIVTNAAETKRHMFDEFHKQLEGLEERRAGDTELLREEHKKAIAALMQTLAPVIEAYQGAAEVGRVTQKVSKWILKGLLFIGALLGVLQGLKSVIFHK